MKRFFALTVAALAMLAVTTQVQAGAALDQLTNNNKINELVDDDYELLLGTSVPGAYVVGDIFVGMFEIEGFKEGSTTTDATSIGATFTGFLVAKIASAVTTISGTEANTNLTFTNLTDGEYSTMRTTNGWLNLPAARQNQLSALLVYEDSTPNPGGIGEFVNADAGSINASFGTVEGPLVFEFGFGGNALARAQEKLDIVNDIYTFNFQLALNNTYFGAAVPWQFGAVTNVIASRPTDIQVTGLVTNGDPGDFAIPTQSTMYINPVPEPGSMLLFGFGALGLLGGAKLRRRNAA